jgi:hypothetical protein
MVLTLPNQSDNELIDLVQAITQKLQPSMIQFLSKSLPVQTNQPLEESRPTTFWDLVLSVSSNSSTSVPVFDSPLSIPADKAKFQFFLGPKFSGAPMHSHGPAFNFLLQGEKLWSLLPPGES